MYLAVWLVGAMFIFSVGTPEPREDYPFITEVKWDKNTRYVLIFYVFGLLWINAFLIGCSQFIIGASTCIWYFEVNTDSRGKGSVGRAFWWCIRYNMASVAFGSCIIATC